MLEKGGKSAPARSREWDSSGGDGEVAETGGELEGEEKPQLAMGREQMMPDFFFSFAEPAVRLTGRGGRHEAQRLMDIVLDGFS